MKKHIQPIVGVLIALVLQSCASVPAYLDKRLDSTEAALIIANDLAMSLRSNGFISDADWPQVEAGFTKAFTDITSARQGEFDKLDNVQALLAELNKRLLVMHKQQELIPAERSGAPPSRGTPGGPGTFKLPR